MQRCQDFASMVPGDSTGEEGRKQRGHLSVVDLPRARQALPDRRAVNRIRLLVVPEEHGYSADEFSLSGKQFRRNTLTPMEISTLRVAIVACAYAFTMNATCANLASEELQVLKVSDAQKLDFKEPCRSLTLSRDGTFCTAFGVYRIAEFAADRQIAELRMQHILPQEIDGTIGPQGEVKYFSQLPSTKRELHVLAPPKFNHGNPVMKNVVGVAPNADLVATWKDDRLAICSVADAAKPIAKYELKDLVMRTVRISDDAQRAVVLSGYFLDTDAPPFRSQPTRVWLADFAKNTIEVVLKDRLQNDVDSMEFFVWEHLELSTDGRIAVASGKQSTPHAIQSCCCVIDTMRPSESRMYMLGIDPIMAISLSPNGKHLGLLTHTNAIKLKAIREAKISEPNRDYISHITVVEVDGWKIVSQVKDLLELANDLAIGDGGKAIAACCESGALLIWRPQ